MIQNCKKIIGIAAMALVCHSCSWDVLPRANIDPGEIAVDDMETLLAGCYDGATFSGTGQKHLFFITEDISSDNLLVRASGWGTRDIDQNNISTSNSNMSRWWNQLYVVIYRCNAFMEAIASYSDEDFEGNRKQEMISEARYIRAWAHYQLVTHWGGVPVVQNVNNDLPARDSEETVWEFVIGELEAIKESITPFRDASYASPQAVYALLARIYLVRGDKEKAMAYSKKLMEDPTFELAADYASIWRKESKEMIMQWQATVNDALGLGFFVSGHGRYEFPVTQELYAAFEEGDLRKDATVEVLDTPQSGYDLSCAKYYITGNGDDAIPVSRISEAYLIYAEAAGRENGLDALNEVREIRGLKPILSVASDEEYETILLQERRVEFACEGLRWTDLKRTGRASEFLPTIASPNQLLYPIPVSAIDNNPNLKQNPGY